MLEIDLELSRCRFLDDGIDRQSLGHGRSADLREQFALAAQLGQRIHLLLVRPRPLVLAHAARALEHGRIDEVELKFESGDRRETLGSIAVDDALQHIARVIGAGLAGFGVHRHQHLRRRARRPWRAVDASGNGPAVAVNIPGLDVDPGGFDLSAPDIEAEDRQRHVDTRIAGFGERFGRAPFAAHHAIDVGNEEVDRFDIWIVGQEPFGFFICG
jgi:hypothetical protein